MKKFAVHLLISLLAISSSYACTAFGEITANGTIIGKNRDYHYNPQSFELMQPLPQFIKWYDNKYNQRNQFYALISNNDVKMGINTYGLTAIEEDPPYPSDARKYLQPINGNSEGMILYGVLQNFTTVNQIIPYINQIFSKATPNFYQFADSKSILTVEVGYGTSDASDTRPFSYKLIDKDGQYFTHANTYLTKNFVALNSLSSNKASIAGSNNRLAKIEQFIRNKNNQDNLDSWFMNTQSALTKPDDKFWCRNTSIFRSDIGDITDINFTDTNNKQAGTVSSLIVVNNGSNNTNLDLKIITSIKALPDGQQLINYKELNTSLDKLAKMFTDGKIDFINKTFTRSAVKDGVCY